MRGHTIVETLLVLVMLAVLFSLALPALARSRARLNVTAARNAFVASHAAARAAAAQYGRLSRLHLDPQGGRFWVTVDTAARPGSVRLDTVGPLVAVAARFEGVRMDSPRRTICFEPRGLATARSDCDLPNATVVFRRGDVADTVTLSRLGRLRR